MNNEEIQNYIDQKIREHFHNGIDSGTLKLENIFGTIRTVDAAPTHTPRNLFEQIIVYKNATTYRLYWYDTTNNEWRYATGT